MNADGREIITFTGTIVEVHEQAIQYVAKLKEALHV